MSGGDLAALAFIVLALFIDIVNFGAGVVFIAMLAVGFVFGIATFGTFTVANVIFARGFSVFAHRYPIPFIFIKLSSIVQRIVFLILKYNRFRRKIIQLVVEWEEVEMKENSKALTKMSK